MIAVLGTVSTIAAGLVLGRTAVLFLRTREHTFAVMALGAVGLPFGIVQWSDVLTTTYLLAWATGAAWTQFWRSDNASPGEQGS